MIAQVFLRGRRLIASPEHCARSIDALLTRAFITNNKWEIAVKGQDSQTVNSGALSYQELSYHYVHRCVSALLVALSSDDRYIRPDQLTAKSLVNPRTGPTLLFVLSNNPE